MPKSVLEHTHSAEVTKIAHGNGVKQVFATIKHPHADNTTWIRVGLGELALRHLHGVHIQPVMNKNRVIWDGDLDEVRFLVDQEDADPVEVRIVAWGA